jgi:protein-S-isoprenylcysteine O-methyltransferase Ste14
VFQRLIAQLWLGFLILWWAWALFNKKASRGRSWRGRAWGMRLALIAAIIVVVQLTRLSGLGAWLDRHGDLLLRPARFWQWTGLVLCLAGFLFAIWARLYLGRNWGIPMSLREQHELVTGGPYARVRHPIYSGLMLAGLGTVLALGMQWLPAMVLVGVFFVLSARTEEKMLSEQFPDAYPPYRRRTKMLIPFVL